MDVVMHLSMLSSSVTGRLTITSVSVESLPYLGRHVQCVFPELFRLNQRLNVVLTHNLELH